MPNITEDYILRMINLAVAALLRAIGLRKEGQYEQAEQAIDQALEQLLGLRADLLIRLDDQALLDRLTLQGELDHERAKVVADLYQEQAEISLAQGQVDYACLYRRRALVLWLETALSDPQAAPVDDKIDLLQAGLEQCKIPFELRFTLYSYFEASGSYAKAEQALKLLTTSGEYAAEMRQEYAEFLQRLADRPDLALEQGGLRRDQLQRLIDAQAK
jgi:protein involved in temperature-dependent protein secretion